MYRRGVQRGFSLIELLVVISIISVLSAVILTGVNSARVKARNATRIQLVQEYVKALELVRTNSPSGSYPTVSFGRSCLGDYDDPGYNSSDRCWARNSNDVEDSTLIAALQPYISNPPGDTTQRNGGSFNVSLTGFIYSHPGSGSGCVGGAYMIEYRLEGLNQKCWNQCLTSGTTDGANTRCRYIPK